MDYQRKDGDAMPSAQEQKRIADERTGGGTDRPGFDLGGSTADAGGPVQTMPDGPVGDPDIGGSSRQPGLGESEGSGPGKVRVAEDGASGAGRVGGHG